MNYGRCQSTVRSSSRINQSNNLARPQGAALSTAEINQLAKKQSSNQAFLAMTKEQLRKEIRERQRKMQLAAKELDFMAAAAFRDEIKELQTLLETAR